MDQSQNQLQNIQLQNALNDGEEGKEEGKDASIDDLEENGKIDYRKAFNKKMISAKESLIKDNHAENEIKMNNFQSNYGNYDDEQLRTLDEVERITRLFNLLSHDNIYISEQISILLANVSNSPYFRHIFVTDRCMKSLLKILRD